MTRSIDNQSPTKEQNFIELLYEITATFINLPAGQIDTAIEDAQRRICEFCDLDRVTIWQWLPESLETLELTHLYQTEHSPIILEQSPDKKILSDHRWFLQHSESPPVYMRINARALFPWAAARLRNGNTVAVSRLEDLPDKANLDRDMFRKFATKSTLSIPLGVGGKMIGAVSFASIRHETVWTDILVSNLQRISLAFADALERKRIDMALRDSEARLLLAAESSGADLWTMHLETGRFWVPDAVRGKYGVAPDEDFTLDRFLGFVHPEDRGKITAAVREAVQSRVLTSVEYRITPADGTIQWVVSRGKTLDNEASEPTLLMGVTIDITEKKKQEFSLVRQLKFESLLAEISSTFAKNFLPDDLDHQIEGGLLKLINFFGFDRGGLVKIDWPAMEITVILTAYREEYARIPTGVDHATLFPWSISRIREGHPLYFSDFDELPPEAAIDIKTWRAMGVKSMLHLPHAIDERTTYMIVISSMKHTIVRQQNLLSGVKLVVEIFVNALMRKVADEELKRSYDEINKLKDKLEWEANYLRAEVRSFQQHKYIVGQSDRIRSVLAMINQVAPTMSTVLLTGETGTGKELLARAIHDQSKRSNQPLITVNCATLPPTLIEAELFGREKGAYTGALSKTIGRFELADGSTIFLDEIGELSLELQAKLLRVIEEGTFERLGAAGTIKTDVRIIAATNRDLGDEVRAGRFRADLYYRLNVFPIHIPPLRERLNDIPLLVWSMVNDLQDKIGKKFDRIPDKCMNGLMTYSWPGNVRELRNVVERAMIFSVGDTLDIIIPEAATEQPSSGCLQLHDMERDHITSVLKSTNWRITGKGGAAEILGLKGTTLCSKMKKLGIKRFAS